MVVDKTVEDASATPIPSPRPGTTPTLTTGSNFSFVDETLCVLLVQYVPDHETLVAPYEKKDEVFKFIQEIFVKHAPAQIWRTNNQPSVKTLRCKFESMM